MPAYEAYGTNYNAYDQTRKRNQSYFPNVNPGAGTQQFPLAPGVAEGQARMDQLAATGTYKSRQADFRKKYGQFTQTPADKNLQQFDLSQAYQQGYGAPNPTTQQGPGGQYTVQGGVAAPYNPPNAFQNLASNLGAGARGIGQIASNVGQFAANIGTGFKNAFFPNLQQPAQNQALQAVENFQRSGSFFQQPGPTKPFKYFYD